MLSWALAGEELSKCLQSRGWIDKALREAGASQTPNPRRPRRHVVFLSLRGKEKVRIGIYRFKHRKRQAGRVLISQ